MAKQADDQISRALAALDAVPAHSGNGILAWEPPAELVEKILATQAAGRSYRAIAMALTDAGVKVSPNTLSDWARRERKRRGQADQAEG